MWLCHEKYQKNNSGRLGDNFFRQLLPGKQRYYFVGPNFLPTKNDSLAKIKHVLHYLEN